MNEVNRDVKAAWLAGGKVYQMMSPVMSQMQDFIRQDEEALSSHWGFSRRGMQINAVDEKGIRGSGAGCIARSDRQNSIDSALSDHCTVVVFLSMFYLTIASRSIDRCESCTTNRLE